MVADHTTNGSACHRVHVYNSEVLSHKVKGSCVHSMISDSARSCTANGVVVLHTHSYRVRIFSMCVCVCVWGGGGEL